MLPSVLAGQLKEGLKDYIITTFPMTDPGFKHALQEMLDTPGAIFHEPYLSVKLPFRPSKREGDFFESLKLPFRPHIHQEKAFARLSGEDGRSTVIATGTGSGKTECFTYPALDYCYQHRFEEGIKVLVIYPMNALASDQAKRIAKLIHNSPALKNNITVGMYVGGKTAGEKTMGEDHVITDRETMRLSPPDILLTNYKMLDYLLIRPADAELWRNNDPLTLKYICVDELHTFDGAQGTDLACLLRRLKARLFTPKGYLCCVGTSATMGADDAADKIRQYAAEIFNEPFEEDAVITEDRLTAAEFFENSEALDFTLPSLADCRELEQCIQDGDEKIYLGTAAKAWLSTPLEGDILSDACRLQLADRLMHHRFTQDMLQVINNSYLQTGEMIDQLGENDPGVKELQNPETAVHALLALISHARTLVEGKMQRFLDVQVQLWLRELRRLVAKVAPEDERVFALISDLNDEARQHYLPVVNCRDCGETGWVGLRNDSGSVALSDMGTFYNLYFDCHEQITMVYPYHWKQPLPNNMGRAMFCTDCLRLNISAANQQAVQTCSSCGSAHLIPVIFPLANRTSGSKTSKQFICPHCGSSRGLALMGVRSATAISASISQLFASGFNDDKKTLAFADNVQDAAHHAGFFNARTWRFGLRSAIQRYALDEGDGLSLEDFQKGLTDYWKKQWTREEYVGRMIAPNMVWKYAYENMVRTGQFGFDAAAKTLLSDIDRRVQYETMLEYGITSRIGRTLEKSGCSVMALKNEEITQVARAVQARIHRELDIFHELPERDFERMVLGYCQWLKQKGAIADPVFTLYAEKGQRFLIDSGFADWMPHARSGRNTPGLIAAPGKKNPKKGVFDTFDAKKILGWLENCVSDVQVFLKTLKTDFSLIAGIIFEELRKASFLLPLDKEANLYGLNKAHLFISTDVRQMKCPVCGTEISVSAENTGIWENAHCIHCASGYFECTHQTHSGYYGQLYTTGDMARVVAHEHTGLLSREEREGIESVFKKPPEAQQPWDINVLSCTPTLEMGIDIGDLSTVIMCSIPPAQAQFLQRAGRGGRKDGNALTLSVANARPHDLYFFADPKEMFCGSVEPPSVFLQASAVLERQFIAYCMDCWIKQGVPDNAIPEKLRPCLANLKEKHLDRFPFNFIAYVERNLSRLQNGFLAMFEGKGQIDEDTKNELMAFAKGNSLKDSKMVIKIYEAFRGMQDQRAALSAQIKSLNKMIREINKKPQDSSYENKKTELEQEKIALSNVLYSINEKRVFEFLSDEGLLPNYAFPETGIVLKAILSRKERKSDDEGENPHPKKKDKVIYEYQRSAASGISEFAPRNSFYVNSRKLTVDQVDLSTSKIELWRLCPNCSHAQLEVAGETTGSCPNCGSALWADSGQLRTMLRVRMVYSHGRYQDTLIDDKSDDRTVIFYNKQLLVDVDEDRDITKAYQMDNPDFPFGYEYIRKAALREINYGEKDIVGDTLQVAGVEDKKKGFKICRHCGKMAEKDLKRVNHGFACPAREDSENPEHYEDCLFLYREFETEILRLLIPATTLDSDTKQKESFSAAFMLRMKKQFGNVDHLKACISEVPMDQAACRKQYLVIYDTVPGGTGYLKQIVQKDGMLIDIFEKALAALEICSCKEDPQKDGCYHCLFAYRQSQNIGKISRRCAVKLVKSILSGQKNLKVIPKIGNIPINTLLESELEKRFVEALNQMKTVDDQPVSVTRHLVRGKEGYRVCIKDSVWEMEPQVELDGAMGIAANTRADFVLWPAEKDHSHQPVAVYTDGFEYHAGRIDGDVFKREAVRRSDAFRVWTLSWGDVENLQDKKDQSHAVDLLNSQRMPSGPKAYHRLIAAEQADALDMDQLTAMQLLVEYLYRDDGERIFKSHAYAYALALLDPQAGKEARGHWRKVLTEISEQLPEARPILDEETSFVGEWHPDDLHDSILVYAGAGLSAITAEDYDAFPVFCILKDALQDSTDPIAYQKAWNGFWQFFNVMQFSRGFTGVTTKGLQKKAYTLLPTWPKKTVHQSNVPGEWQEILDNVLEEAVDFAKQLMQSGIPVPDAVGYELTDANGMVLGEAEMAWIDRKILWLIPENKDRKDVFGEQGWQVIDENDLHPEWFE